MRRLDGRFGTVLVLVASLAILGSANALPPEEESAKPRAVHADSQKVIESVLRATRAFMAEDAKGARASLDGLKEHSPPLLRGRDDAYGHEMLSFDQAFHITIDRSREYALAGHMEDSFNQFVWVQRACITCHGMARKKGFLPPLPQTPGESE
jgi:hypothetical protein